LKTRINDELTREYLHKLGWQNYLATTIFVVLVTVSIFWSLFHIGGDQGLMRLSNTMYPLSSAIGATWAFITAYRARSGPLRLERHYQLAWLLAASGLLANGFGGVYFTYLQMTGVSDTVPSPGDIGFTLFYPLTFVALLIMPSAIRFRKRVALDSAITTLCILGVSWFFFISTVFVTNKNANESLYTFFITVSYSFWDMLLILAVVLLVQRRTEPILRTSLIIFTTGILCQIWADTGYAYALAIGKYYTGMVYIDPLWFIGFMLFGLSALYQYSALARRVYNEQTHPTQAVTRRVSGLFRHGKQLRSRRTLVQSTLIYLPLVILLILTLYSAYSDGVMRSDRSFFMVVLTAIVGILVAIRYLITTRENEVLLGEREQSRQEAELLRLLGTELTNILELDSLLERIVIIATSDLGFDASILILNEKDGHPLYGQSRLMVHAATSSSTESITWRLEDTNLQHNTLLLETEKDVIWIAENIELPPEVEKWHQEQNIHTTLFMRLAYQGKHLGSLGFASRTEQHFNQHDKTLAKAFAEQVAPIIEHTRLYQITYEQELFAKAMANIAARLNAAAIEPSEIQQIICAEAAYALRTDYALLYGIDDSSKLIPLALYADEHEPHTTLSDWPPIYQAEYEAQVLTELQPLLIQFNAPPTYGNGYDKALVPAISSHSNATGSIPVYTTPRESIDGFPTSLLREKLVQRSVHSAIFAPLISSGDPLGLLILARSLPPRSHDKRALSSAELSQAQDFAEQAVVALTNAYLYQRQREANRRLQEVDQLKDQFMMTASHELRTPLTAVQGYIELIAQYDESLPAEQRQEFLQKARRSCEELVVLLDNVMDVSRLEMEAGIRPAHIERVSLQEMINSVLDLIEPQLTQEQREVHLNIPEQLAVRADKGQLRQVLVNICANALKYSAPMTPVAFAARAVLDHSRYAIISVSDGGLGIAPQYQASLFQRFVRLERDMNSPIRGSGLGLYISRRLIEAMKGSIWIESSGIPGEGSTFHIQLPLAE
jgi:signal transduction histidine kinase